MLLFCLFVCPRDYFCGRVRRGAIDQADAPPRETFVRFGIRAF